MPTPTQLQYEEAKRMSAYWLDQERKLRVKLVEETFPAMQGNTHGTASVVLDNGWEMKCQVKREIKWLGTAEQFNTAEMQMLDCGMAPEIIERLLKRKFDVSYAEYERLMPAQKLLLQDVVQVRNTPPTITIISPKGQ